MKPLKSAKIIPLKVVHHILVAFIQFKKFHFYKGCKANRDSYSTREECEAHCSNTPRPIEDLALLRGKSPECNLPTQVCIVH